MASRGVKVSVMMAAYNVASFIDEAVQSVLAQAGVVFELLIGDDASTDNTWARIQNHLPDPRVRAWRFKRHEDLGALRNHLMAHARGDYLSICDADDVMLPDNLKRLAAVLDGEPRVGIAYGRLRTMDVRGALLNERLSFPGPLRAWDLLASVVPHPGTMFRLAMINSLGGYRLGLAPAEDYDLFLRLAEVTRIKSLHGSATYLYRRRPTSLYHATPHRRQLLLWRKIRLDAIRRRYGVALSARSRS